jgi:hypothetical protein
MMKVFFFVMSFVVVGASCGVDARAEGLKTSVTPMARSYPLSAWVDSEVAYEKLLWGSNGEGRVDYGFLRPKVGLGTIGLMHEASAGLEVYPISFVKFAVDTLRFWRNSETEGFDCQVYACRGTIDRLHLAADAALAAQGYFLQLSWRQTTLTPSVDDRPFVDEGLRLLGAEGGDSAVRARANVGYKVSPDLACGLSFTRTTMSETEERSLERYLFGSYTLGAWNVFAGAGVYSSSRDEAALSLALAASWSPSTSPSLKLF